MRERTNTYFLQLNKDHMLRSTLRQTIAVLSLVVVLIVFWCLKLTGITMAGEAFCGIDEHVHGENCPTGVLICDQKESRGHTHDEGCILRELVCEEAEVAPHTHDDSCLEQELICPLTEQEGHTHDDSCRSRRLICTTEEQEGHSHNEDCYGQELVCEIPEEDGHQHDEDCYSEELSCEDESEGHSHGDSCYTRTLDCDKEERDGHEHGASCYEDVLLCTEEECEGHDHDEDCYVLEEGYVCGQEEIAAHSHEDACYALVEGSFVCGLEETEGHTHTEDCWYTGVGFGCGLTEEEGHVHTEECLTEETELGCGKKASQGHSHTEECYETLEQCPLEEHIHVESCYSDHDADLETSDDWEMSLADVSRGKTTAETVVAVARSQLGYEESILNFEVDKQGIRRGITRYGQWYGNPYGDWSAMFTSFCLYYAGVEDLPANAGPESMRLEWDAAECYKAAEEYAPQIGNLVFLHNEALKEEKVPESAEEPAEAEDSKEQTDESAGDEEEISVEDAVSVYTKDRTSANAVAIITEVTQDTVTVIQGDLDNTVAEMTYAIDDPAILGYGLVPEVSAFALMAMPMAETEVLAKTVSFNSGLFAGDESFVIYTASGGTYYAFDGNGNAVPIEIDGAGNIRTNSSDINSLLWDVTPSGGSYVIKNLGTGRHLHPFFNNWNDYGVMTTGGWSTSMTASGSGATLSASAYARLNSGLTGFEMTQNQWEASVFQFGISDRCTIWLDGTNGGLMNFAGSDKSSYTVTVGDTITLPSEWKSPEKYSYVLKGWYDVGNGRYYKAGEEVTVTGETLFYADWVAATYDIGQMNRDVVDTVSTAEFITTHVFDYNALFNVLSMNNDYSGGDTANWTLLEDGTVNSTGEETLNFVFIDYDGQGDISYPNNRNDVNGVDYSRVWPGLYNENLADLLFNREVELAGKHYVGTGDYLFRYGGDSTDTEHYGYYYYDSMLNAASYNQSNERFYVYDYLERTADAANNDSYSDFLPLNSPYANTNGKTTGSYTYDGVHNEYVGTQHVSYDSKYNTENNSTDRIMTNYMFGMTMEMDFYLPAVPGTVDSEGVLANQSINGKDMVFEFSGDDDVWVLIDGKLVLDIGGIHGVEAGSIDFSTGDVIVDGVKTGTVTDLSAGSHTLTMYYLERGSSMSNFKLRFNLSTRYSMTLRKEDTLTAQLLNGAQFAVYTNEECSHPAELWSSKDAHDRGDPATNIFTVENGVATMWGFAAGNTYYFEEIRGPDALNGMMANGIIRMRLNNQGLPDYEILANADGDLTVGYMVHGFKVNEDTQEAYLVITNTDAVESEPTEVYVEKVWADTKDHSGDSITAYLSANGIRIQAVTLNEENDWKHTWVNLPKTDADGKEITYTVREATVPGYVGEVEAIPPPASDGGSSSGGNSGSSSGGVTSVNGFTNGQTYLLHTAYGYIGASGNQILLENSESAAQNSNTTQWVAAVNSDGTVTLTNKAGQTLYWDSYTFRASSSPGTNKNMKYADGKLYCPVTFNWGTENQYPIDDGNVVSNVTYNGVFYNTNNSAQALTITPQQLGGSEPDPEPEPEPDPPSEDGKFYRITNTPAGEATVSLTVKKQWDPGNLGSVSDYEELSVQMRLLADGEDAGLTGTLNLRNGWTYTFEDLPKFDSGGDEIDYTVEEINLPSQWRPEYGPVTSVGGSETAYETTVTNVFRETVELPSTGSFGRNGYTMLGLLIMLGGLGWYCGQRRKCERREC